MSLSFSLNSLLSIKHASRNSMCQARAECWGCSGEQDSQGLGVQRGQVTCTAEEAVELGCAPPESEVLAQLDPLSFLQSSCHMQTPAVLGGPGTRLRLLRGVWAGRPPPLGVPSAGGCVPGSWLFANAKKAQVSFPISTCFKRCPCTPDSKNVF